FFIHLLLILSFTAPSTTTIYTLSLHDALPIHPKPAEDRRCGEECASVSGRAERIRKLRRLLLAIRRWPAAAESVEFSASDSRNDRRIGRVQPRTQAPRFQLCWIDGHLRTHAS